MKSTISQTVTEEMKSVIGEHGFPDKVVTDNGPQYASRTFAQFTKEWNFNGVTSSLTYAQSNGFIEQMVRTAEGVMKKASHSNTDPEMASLCLRTTPIDHYIPRASEMLYNNMIRSNLPLKARNEVPYKDIIDERLIQRQENQKAYYDRSAKDLAPLIQGQDVLIQNDQERRWEKATATHFLPKDTTTTELAPVRRAVLLCM